MLNKIKGGLIVSCQALPDEPLHSSFIMGRMALAATLGGAVGIRANTAKDIIEIRKNTELPIVGIVKKDYLDTKIYITGTLNEIKELSDAPCEMIAIDATDRKRHQDALLENFLLETRKLIRNKLLMADVSTLDEAKRAEELGFDCISTTLIGYTEKTSGRNIADNDFEILSKIIEAVKIPVIAEGNVDTPEKAKKCLSLGAHAIVTGGAITRPQLITKKFVEAIS